MSSRSINKVMLIGNLTRDPELKYTPAGVAVATFSVATNRSWTTADGQTKEEAQYHRIVSWQKLAELCGKLLSKGKRVYVEGRITYRSFTDKTGAERQVTEIVMDDFIVLSDAARTTREYGAESDTTPAPAQAAHKDVDMPEPSTPPSESINPDDIPF